MKSIFEVLHEKISSIISNIWPDVNSKFNIEYSAHADFACNAGMILAKLLNAKPYAIAESIKNDLQHFEMVKDVNIAGPGFININVKNEVWKNFAYMTFTNTDVESYNIGKGRKVNIEYVSANPTGPMHAGHARGAVIGDVLANLLKFAGYDVCKEYYINDSGSQAAKLGYSVYLRYKAIALKEECVIPADCYPGEYLQDVAQDMFDKHGAKFVAQSYDCKVFEQYAIDVCMSNIKKDLLKLGINHDVFFSESSITDVDISKCLDILQNNGMLYKGVLEKPKGKAIEDWEAKEQVLFKSTMFGDDVDRPLQKSDGSWTYFAKDIAYHYNKFTRGFDSQIDVWGADHSGYVKRMQIAMKSLVGNSIDILICQIVNFTQDGKQVKMSKRRGTFLELYDLIEEVGKNAVRYMMLSKKPSSQLDFDFDIALDQSANNPVFYIEYAYVRIHSVERYYENFSITNFDLLDNEYEIAVMKKICMWPYVVKSSVSSKEPHHIAFFILDLASAFHTLWQKGHHDAQMRFIQKDNHELTCARMSLNRSVAQIIKTAASILGLDLRTQM